MQSIKEKAAVQAFYYGKIAEGVSPLDALSFIQVKLKEGDLWRCPYADNFGVVWVHYEYRIKPKAVMHPGGEYPEPCRDVGAIIDASVLYSPLFFILNGHLKISFGTNFRSSDDNCEMLAKTGLMHLTEEGALQHAEVLYGNKGEES